MIVEERNSNEIRDKAIEEGMKTLLSDGMLKVKRGITTPAEVLSKVYET